MGGAGVFVIRMRLIIIMKVGLTALDGGVDECSCVYLHFACFCGRYVVLGIYTKLERA